MFRRMAFKVLPAIALALMLTGVPAPAQDRGGIEVAHGQTISKDFPRIEHPMPLADVSFRPSHCTTATYCDRMKLKVGLAPTLEDAKLTVRLEWKGAPQPTALNYCILYVWDDPEGPADVKRASCVNNIATLDFVPIKPNYQIVVRNFTAVHSEGYTLKLSYK